MSKYAQAALEALSLIRGGDIKSPAEAWNRATVSIYGAGTPQKKGCPKDAFLGLCGEGMIIGIPPGRYTNSKCSARYAVDAAELLQRQPKLAANPKTLWTAIMKGVHKTHNNQMDVVIALWNSNAIRLPDTRVCDPAGEYAS